MNTDDANSLAVEANRQLDNCCESACEKDPVREYINYLEHKINLLEKANKAYDKLHHKLIHESPERSGHFFICGRIGEDDGMGLPNGILICPSYGLDGFAVYTKTKDYTAPEW